MLLRFCGKLLLDLNRGNGATPKLRSGKINNLQSLISRILKDVHQLPIGFSANDFANSELVDGVEVI